MYLSWMALDRKAYVYGSGKYFGKKAKKSGGGWVPVSELEMKSLLEEAEKTAENQQGSDPSADTSGAQHTDCGACGAHLGLAASFCSSCGSPTRAKSSKGSTLPSGNRSPSPNRDSFGSPTKAAPKNSIAPWALGLGIASVFLFEFLIPMLAAIPLGIVGLSKASELKRVQAAKTGFAQSLVGLILGIVYSVQFVLVSLLGIRP